MKNLDYIIDKSAFFNHNICDILLFDKEIKNGRKTVYAYMGSVFKKIYGTFKNYGHS